ncbi:hypothetical protein KP509_01G054400 [Ceratopteris richardii]|uniref:NPH3 domain-containing protein n=1 Tax=Ceratopteris richardii TaxID=49495 RepID=A0A8T2VGG0_CERRI|nr:hypothetical protein KP509_01G054400 [Ceratopteris richardii]
MQVSQYSKQQTCSSTSPLTSRCGLLKMLVMEEREGETSRVELEGLPGGAEGFESAAKFCYGVPLEITNHNVALLRCVAEFLDMSEENGEANLIFQTENYLEDLSTKTLKDIVETLQSCELLLPMAEELYIVRRCIDWIAAKVVLEQDIQWNQKNAIVVYDSELSQSYHSECWVDDISGLHISFFQRILLAMRERGLGADGIAGALVSYTQKSIIGLCRRKNSYHNNTILKPNKINLSDIPAATRHEQRIFLETIVRLLSKEKIAVPVGFLIDLLRTAYIIETTLACKLDLEKLISAQLHDATLDDLLLPSFTKQDGETQCDIGLIHRLIASFIELQYDDDYQYNMPEVYEEAHDLSNSSPENPMLKVGKLLDGYLAEIARDANLSLSKFIALADILPNCARLDEDGLYRAIDIYLKSHPYLTDAEKNRLCGLMNFQKLTQDACRHAAQNERLPVQAVIQVLYFERSRLNKVMTGRVASENVINHTADTQIQHKMSNGLVSAALWPKDDYTSVRQENIELKLEVAKMRMRLSELEKDHLHMKLDMEKAHALHESIHHHHQGLLQTFSKSISKFNPFHNHKPKLSFYSCHQKYNRGQKSHSHLEPHESPIMKASSQASSFEAQRNAFSSIYEHHLLS